MARVGHDEGARSPPPDGAAAAAANVKPPPKPKAKKTPKEYPCPICGMVIKHSSNFHRHMRRQHQAKPCVCRVCGKAFRDSYELKNHTDSGAHVAREPKQRYTCATCGGHFSSQRALLHHSHDKVRAFPCDICRRQFQTAVVCAAHRRRHFWRELPRCRACSATFASELHLSRHIRNHESETAEPVRY